VHRSLRGLLHVIIGCWVGLFCALAGEIRTPGWHDYRLRVVGAPLDTNLYVAYDLYVLAKEPVAESAGGAPLPEKYAHQGAMRAGCQYVDMVGHDLRKGFYFWTKLACSHRQLVYPRQSRCY